MDIITTVYNLTQWYQGLRTGQPPSSICSWGTCSLGGALSWPHLDCDGLCTAVQIMTGLKLWFFGYPVDGAENPLKIGVLNSTNCYPDKWEASQPVSFKIKWEGIVLGPGMMM